MNLIKKMLYAMKKKQIISIEYNKNSNSTPIQVVPIIMFQHNEKEYLLAEETRTEEIKNYAISNIEKVEMTSINYSKEYREPLSLINRNFFRNPIKEIKDIKDIKEDIKTSNPYSNIISYMIESLRAERINEISFYSDSKEIYKINEENLVNLLIDQRDQMFLDKKFKTVFDIWDKEIRRTPDLSIYVGYPMLKRGTKLLPILYFKCRYNRDQNTISDIDNGYLNEKLCDEVIELTKQEIKDLIRKEITLEDISALIESDIQEFKLLNTAVLFLHRDPLEVRYLINDIKSIEKDSISTITQPLHHLFKNMKKDLVKNTNQTSIMIVPTNEAQETAIQNAQSNNISVIQGPPGTGKTQTIINIIINNLISGRTTLVASTNNKAVDNVVEKLQELNMPDFYLRLGNKNVLKDLEEGFKDKLLCIDKYKADNIIDSSEAIKAKMELLDKDRIAQRIYHKNLKKQEEYYALLRKRDDLKRNLDMELKKLLDRNIAPPTEAFIEQYDSTRLLAVLKELEYILVEVSSKQEGNWNFLERLIGLFTKKEIRYIKKITQLLGEIVTKGEPIETLSDLARIISREVDRYRYALTDRYIYEFNKKIKKTNIRKIEGDLETTKLERISYAKALIKNQILMNVATVDLSEIELDFKDEEKFNRLLKIFPIIVCTNLSLPNCIPKEVSFDMGIIDEASQCDIPATIPTIKRSHNIVIIGDDKQLNPITTINERLDDFNLRKYNINENIKYRDNSIFDAYRKLAGAYTFLNRHYRSKDSIIQFSNVKFYGSKLKVMTHEGDGPNIHLINVKGYTQYSKIGSKSGFNTLEVQSTFDYLKKLKHADYQGSIGIISPFRKQKQAFEEMIMKKKDPFYKNIDIGTVHTFQGYEKDTILFSTVISKNAKPGSIQWLNQMEKLLNVAITRAKNRFVLIGDQEVLTHHQGILRELVLYIIQRGATNTYKPRSIFDTLNIAEFHYNRGNNLKSLLNPYESRLYELLKGELKDRPNYEVYPKVRVADVVNIDSLKFKDPEKFSYGLKAHFDFIIFKYGNGVWPICAIELDGKQHSYDPQTQYRDKMKDDICRILGFKIIRIKTTDKTNLNKMVNDAIR